MEHSVKLKHIFGQLLSKKSENNSVYSNTKKNNQLHNTSLIKAKKNCDYQVKSINTSNTEIQDFLFTLGCYAGETITVISELGDQFVVVIKDARYSIDRSLASCIMI